MSLITLRRNAPLVHRLEDAAPEAGPDHDGLSLYRCLARQVYGDPLNFPSVLKAVQDHFLRVWIQPTDSLHARYHKYVDEWSNDSAVSTFFGSLSCPDIKTQQSTLEVIANVLNVCITIWDEIPTPSRPRPNQVANVGPVSFPEIHVLRTVPKNKHNNLLLHYDSLLEDESGSILIDYMTQQKDREDLEIKEIIWYKTVEEDETVEEDNIIEPGGSKPKKYKCWNESRDETSRPPLNKLDNALCVFSISVSNPTQIGPALGLLKEALARAPMQQTSVPHHQGRLLRPLKAYVGIDAEFKTLALGKEWDSYFRRDLRCSPDAQDEQEDLSKGNIEHLCSVLTIAIDRHVVFSFHVLDMLMNATNQTVENVYKLFAETVFDDRMLKMWFNYQSDITVLDATIAHMYQGTPRERHFVRDRNSNGGYWVQPTWKFGNQYLNGERPAKITFRAHNDECSMHQQFGANETDMEHRLGCPCYLGNIDISALLDYICRQLRCQNEPSDESSFPDASLFIFPRYWIQNRKRCNYGDFLGWTIGSDPLYPLFNQLKNIPDDIAGAITDKYGYYLTREGRDDAKKKWYNSFGAGMECDDQKMGYNIGDVVGIALFMRFLTTTDDRKLLAERLSNYSGMEKINWESLPSRPRLSSILRPSNPGIPLFEDYPRMWRREVIGAVQLPGHEDSVAQEFKGLEDIGIRSLNYHDHEERVREGQEALETTRQRGHLTKDDIIEKSMLLVHEKLFDPTKFELPAICTEDPPGPSTDQEVSYKPIVRAGTSHTEDLIREIWAYKNRNRQNEVVAPPGYMEKPGKALGLPKWLNRTPGSDLGPYLKAAFDAVNSRRLDQFPKHESLATTSPLVAPPPRSKPSHPASQGYDLFDQNGDEYRKALEKREARLAQTRQAQSQGSVVRKNTLQFWNKNPIRASSVKFKGTPQQAQENGPNASSSSGMRVFRKRTLLTALQTDASAGGRTSRAFSSPEDRTASQSKDSTHVKTKSSPEKTSPDSATEKLSTAFDKQASMEVAQTR